MDEKHFKAALDSYVAGCQRISEEDQRQRFPSLSDAITFRVEELQLYVRVVRNGTGVHSYIDKATGEVFKPAGWKGPAKTKIKRGNIFEDDNGLGCIGPCGVMNAEKLRTARKASAA
jgi:hypothetical protein